jgi:hypothetical protein
MPRTNITPTAVPARYSSNGAQITWVNGDTVNNHAFVLTENQVLLAWNADAAAARTITITSAPDVYGRTKDITAYNMAFGTIHVFEPFKQAGWLQADGTVYVSVSNAAVKLAVLTLP